MEKYICEYCEKEFNEQHRLNTHLTKYHFDKKLSYKVKCRNPKCDFYFETYKISNYIKPHPRCCSKECIKEVQSITSFKMHNSKTDCHICNKKFASKNDLELHIKKQHLGKSVECNFCNATYNSKEKLHQHYKEKHSIEEVLLEQKCENPNCNKTFELRIIGDYIIDNKRFCSKRCSRVYIGIVSGKHRTYSYDRLNKLLNSQGSCKWYDYIDKNGKKHRVQGLYEYSFAKKLDELNVEFISHPKGIQYVNEKGKKTYYFPDFYIPSKNLYIDTKAKFYLDNSGNKFKILREQHPELNLLILTEKYLEAFGIDLKNIHKYKNEIGKN